MHSKVATNAHPTSARECPEPSISLAARFFILVRVIEPPRMVPFMGAWVDTAIAMEAVGRCPYSDAARYLVIPKRAGRVGSHARLVARDSSFESKRLHYDRVKDGEDVQLFRAGHLDSVQRILFAIFERLLSRA